MIGEKIFDIFFLKIWTVHNQTNKTCKNQKKDGILAGAGDNFFLTTVNYLLDIQAKSSKGLGPRWKKSKFYINLEA